MNLAVPTVMCQVLMSKDITVGASIMKAGEIVDMPFGTALMLKLLGGGSIVDEPLKLAEAQENLAVYGGDCWFPHAQQTMSRVADYLAAQGLQNNTIH